MNMRKSLNRDICIFVFLIFLFSGCTQILPTDYSEKGVQNIIMEDLERALVDVRQEEAKGLTSTDWLVCGSEFYVKIEEDTYEKRDISEEVQYILKEEENTYFYLKKVENRLVIESEFYFFIYDFTTNRLQKYNTEYGHLGWQIFEKTIYFIENTHSRQTRLVAYDIVSGTVNKIDTGEYMPVQFRVRQDGAIGMWGENAKGEKEYCFWESMTPIYVSDKDEYFGWTNLCGFTERGIILEREYSTSSLRGTKIYEITKEGEISILAGISDWENLKAIPEGSLIFENNRIVAIDVLCGLVKAYDYELSCIGELQWDIDSSEEMEFEGYCVQGDDIWGIWKLTNENLYKLGLLCTATPMT